MQYFNTTTNPIVGVPNDWSDITGDINSNQALVDQLNDLINKQLYFSDINNLTQVLDQIVGDDNEIYIGGLPDAEGTWKLSKAEDGSLYFSVLQSGNWEARYAINPY